MHRDSAPLTILISEMGTTHIARYVERSARDLLRTKATCFSHNNSVLSACVFTTSMIMSSCKRDLFKIAAPLDEQIITK